MKRILEDLWYGNLSPAEHLFEKDSEYAHLLSLTANHSDDLHEKLSIEAKSIFEKYQDCSLELSEMEERAAFAKGFSLGVKLMMAALSTDLSV